MTAIATSVAELGIGDYDGQLKVIEYGPSAGPTRIGMRWLDSSDLWVQQRPRATFTYRDSWPQTSFASVAGSLTYFTLPVGGWTGGQIGQNSYGWNAVAIHHVDAAFAAGLVFQERLMATQFMEEASGTGCHLHTVHFEIEAQDMISTLISVTAIDNIGITIDALHNHRAVHDSGWQNSLKQSSEKPIFAPHLYTSFDTGQDGEHVCEFVSASWRWVADPT